MAGLDVKDVRPGRWCIGYLNSWRVYFMENPSELG